MSLMSTAEYQSTLLHAARICELLTQKMDEEMLDLFEEYGDLCARITHHDLEKCLQRN